MAGHVGCWWLAGGREGSILSGAVFIQEMERGLNSKGWAGHRHCEGGPHGFLGSAVGVLCP